MSNENGQELDFMQEFLSQVGASSQEPTGFYNIVPAMVQTGWTASTKGIDKSNFFPTNGPDAMSNEEAKAAAQAYLGENQVEEWGRVFPAVRALFYMENNLGGVPSSENLLWSDVHHLAFPEERWNSKNQEWEKGEWNKEMVRSMWAKTSYGGPVFTSPEHWGKPMWCVVKQENDKTFCWEEPDKNKYNFKEGTDKETGEPKRYPYKLRIIQEILPDLEVAKARAAELGIEIKNDNLVLPDGGGEAQSDAGIPAPDGYDESFGSWDEMCKFLVDELAPVTDSPPPVKNKKVKDLKKQVSEFTELDLVAHVLDHLS